jgi:hypothetical protein
MRLRAVLEVEVPDDVGDVVLAGQSERQENGDKYEFVEYVFLADDYTYNLRTPLVWEVV